MVMSAPPRRVHVTPRHALAAITTGALATVGLVPSPVAAHAASADPVVLSNEVVGPFQLAVNQDRLYVTDGFTGVVAQVTGSGLTPVAQAPGAAGVEFTPNGKTMAFAWSNDDHTRAGLTIRAKGKADVVGNLAAYESTKNPDSMNHYGIIAGGNPCVEAILGQLTGGSASYTGDIDTHPYSVARQGNRWLVADAGANAILAVDGAGHVSTNAVLPPQPTVITQEMVQAFAHEANVPPEALQCLLGVTYAFEPVPTDVEVDQHGTAWVTTLPGGPENPGFGARGSLYRIDAAGSVTRVAAGFLGATNVAVAPDGTKWVAELFGGKITQLRGTSRTTFAQIDSPLAIEVHGDAVYVATLAKVDFGTGQVLAPGSVVKYLR